MSRLHWGPTTLERDGANREHGRSTRVAGPPWWNRTRGRSADVRETDQGTLGRGITRLDVVSAFSAQMAAALAVHFFSILGIPVSTSQSIVGAVIGVGLYHGVRTVELKKIGEIVIGWVVTPTAAGLFSFGLYKVLLAIIG